MIEAVASPLSAWESFYVIVGSSAGALIGLQFVVISLLRRPEAQPSRGEATAAFGSPNVVHFCAALLVSAVSSAPWSSTAPVGTAMATCGLAGVLYCGVVLRRARRQQVYEPVHEDWIWHVILPALAYFTLLAAGIAAIGRPHHALFVIAFAALFLVFIGIHNAWDTVTYVAFEEDERDAVAAEAEAKKGGG